MQLNEIEVYVAGKNSYIVTYHMRHASANDLDVYVIFDAVQTGKLALFVIVIDRRDGGDEKNGK